MRDCSEYLEIVQKSAFEMFNQDENEAFASNQEKEKTEKQKDKSSGWQLIKINDDLLKGKSSLRIDTAETLRQKGQKSALKLKNLLDRSASQDLSHDKIKNISAEEENLSQQDSDKQEDSFGEEKSSIFFKENKIANGQITKQMSH